MISGLELFLALVVLGAVVAFVVIGQVKSARRDKASEQWPTVDGSIISAELSDPPWNKSMPAGASEFWNVKVKYQYEVGGKTYIGSFVTLVGGDRKIEAARRYLADIQGAKKLVRVNANSPDDTVIVGVRDGVLEP